MGPALIAEGQELVRQCLRRNRPGPYQIQAAINAVHSDARDRARRPTGARSSQLYDQLLALTPNPVVALHRAVAVAEVDGPDARWLWSTTWTSIDYHLFHAIRADLLRRLGRDAEAVAAYDVAIALTENSAERDFLQMRRAELMSGQI